MKGTDKVLLIDDDEKLVQTIARRFKTRFDIVVATGAVAALTHIKENGPPAVIVADYKMPEMNGVTLLRAVQERFPETSRIMLTGEADLAVAMDAVNEGAIFRFLTKPCPGEALSLAISDGLQLATLKRSEKVLLEKTLTGSVQVLCDVLSLCNPVAFGRATRLRTIVQRVIRGANVPQPWRLETAALLSQIGWVALPPELPTKVQSGKPVTDDEARAIGELPKIAAGLLEKIPRLETVSRIIRALAEKPEDIDEEEVVASQILAVAQKVEKHLGGGTSIQQAVTVALTDFPDIPAPVAAAFRSIKEVDRSRGDKAVRITHAKVGSVVAHDVVAKDGTKLLGKGQEISATGLARLITYVQLGRLDDRVLLADGAGAEANAEAA